MRAGEEFNKTLPPTRKHVTGKTSILKESSYANNQRRNRRNLYSEWTL